MDKFYHILYWYKYRYVNTCCIYVTMLLHINNIIMYVCVCACMCMYEQISESTILSSWVF